MLQTLKNLNFEGHLLAQTAYTRPWGLPRWRESSPRGLRNFAVIQPSLSCSKKLESDSEDFSDHTLKVETAAFWDPEIDEEYWELATFRHPSKLVFGRVNMKFLLKTKNNDIQQSAKIWRDSSNQKGFSRRIHQPSPSFSRHHRKTSNFVMHEPTWRLEVPWNFEAFKNRRTWISRV